MTAVFTLQTLKVCVIDYFVIVLPGTQSFIIEQQHPLMWHRETGYLLGVKTIVFGMI